MSRILPSIVHASVEWSLPPELQAECENYFLLHWSGITFANSVTSHGGIYRNGILYNVRYLRDMPYSRCILAERLGLSFRLIKGHAVGYVIPRIIRGRGPVDTWPKKT